MNDRPFLQYISLREDIEDYPNEYPYTVPSVKHLIEMEFHSDVTFLVGENGAGKSTLIEAIAQYLGFNPEGGTKNVQLNDDPETTSGLYDELRGSKSFAKPTDHFFLRAESFYNIATYLDEIGSKRSYGGKSLHEQSHGEAFMAVLLNRLQGNGLYLFDEPESALSPERQFTAIVAMHKLVSQNSQFIIATHSPIFLAYPHATIYQITKSGIEQLAFEETEHFKTYKMFFDNHQGLMHNLLKADT